MASCTRSSSSTLSMSLSMSSSEPDLVASDITNGVLQSIHFLDLSEARSRLYRSKILQANTRWKALDEIYIFSFAPFQISVIFQDFCTIFAKFGKIFVDFR